MAYRISHPSVVPAHAGVDRQQSRDAAIVGVVPAHAGVDRYLPRGQSRGWTAKERKHIRAKGVVPAHAGVDRAVTSLGSYSLRCPRARGGGPRCYVLVLFLATLSPRTRGWTAASIKHRSTVMVVPAHAGVDRLVTGLADEVGCCPRARGGGPP